jgi:hypothetical protein
MSLGSKELFHSNFLHWLSVIDWDRFIEVLHKLAGLNGDEKFWWEGQICNVGVDEIEEGTPQDFHPEYNNIEVRREYNHYDLSIYILTGYSKPRKNSESQKKWCPVFILENKVKSMPYQSQLDGYTEKVVNEWKANVEPNHRKKNIAKLWKDKPVTFVLLSLFSEVEINNSKIEDNQIGSIKWEKNDYHNLSRILESFPSKTDDLTNKVIEDYCKFISALHGLSESDDWKVVGSDNYHSKILQCGNEEKNLRIADLLEKVRHERMLKLLEEKLKDKFPNECKHWNKDEEYNTGVIFYRTSFSRGTGITEVVIIINEGYRLMIQLQNCQYRKCLILHPKDKESEEELENRRERIRERLSESLWERFNPSKSFGKYFKYEYETIDQEKTTDYILDKVVEDIKNIRQNFEKLKD